MELIAPQQGNGLHNWLLRQSRRLLVLGWTVEEVSSALLQAAEASNRTTQDLATEIENSVLGAKAFLDENPGWQENVSINTSRWVDPYTWAGLGDTRRDSRNYRSVEIDIDLRREALAWGRGRLVRGTEVRKFNFYDLFAGIDFQLCACVEMDKPEFRRFNGWNPDLSNNFRDRQYIVSNPFVDTDGRYDLNVGRRLYMVIEADKGTIDEQLAILAYIERRCKVALAMCVFSGGKSVHGWFCTWNVSNYRITSIHIMAKKLGADKTTYSPSQWVRMPRGFNYKTGVRQKLLWYNREAVLAQKKLVEAEVLSWS